MTLPTSGPLTFSDIQTEFGGTNPIGLDEYYAGGANVPAGTSGTYGAVPSSGALSVQNFYGTTAFTPIYIEEVFSTYLYTGTGAALTITNNIDLSTKGGMVWCKARSSAENNFVFDTVRGATQRLITNGTQDQYTASDSLTAFTSSGFTLGSGATINQNGITNASWTFRKQPKFFDVVTWSGNNVDGRAISHNLGSTPGCILIKRTSGAEDWIVYHRSFGQQYYAVLNSTIAFQGPDTAGPFWNTAPTDTTFTVRGYDPTNKSGSTYVAYLFAHNAGGFGAAGTDNVITCGKFEAGSNNPSGSATVTLDYEPQLILTKNATGTSTTAWQIYDNMRGVTALSPPSYPTSNALNPNTAGAEGSTGQYSFNATGFVNTGGYNNGDQIIYIAIRRGPMKVPTSGTSVFSAQTGTYSAGDSLSVGFPADMYIDAWRTGTLYKANYSRLVKFANSNSSASQNYLKTNTTDAEVTTSQAPSLYDLWNTTAKVGSWNQGVSEVWWMFGRAPSFFDEVCYTSDGTYAVQNHNLGVVPQLVILKQRNATGNWFAYTATQLGYLELTDAFFGFPRTLTSTTFQPASAASGGTFVAYLFATCAGVSKVGTYTGTGALLTVNCGFTAGARFVLIKRTDSTGGWYTYDSARGITASNDPYLFLNSTAAEVTNTNYVDTDTTGFKVTAAAPAGLNASGGTYIFLAIA